jgi:hypothetical protein
MFLLEKALLVLFQPWFVESVDQGDVEAIEILIGPVAGL